jgi:hypothetical protein
MTIETFLNEIGKLRQKALQLQSSGKSGVIIEHTILGLECEKNENEIKSSKDFINFIDNYNTKFSLLGEINFDEKVTEVDKYYFIGWSDIDRLVINKDTNEVISMDSYVLHRIVFYCAKNFESFLEAYLINGIGNFEFEFEKEEEQWNFYRQRAIRAAEAAGGSKYLDYWLHIWPTEDPYRKTNRNKGGLYN